MYYGFRVSAALKLEEQIRESARLMTAHLYHHDGGGAFEGRLQLKARLRNGIDRREWA